MKQSKLPLLGLSLVLLVGSCKKDDFQETAPSDLTETVTGAAAIDTTGWKAASQWETADQENFSVRYFTLDDAAITSDVADNGLVLLFKRSGAAVNSLPFEESAKADAATASNYWYHQVTEGSLLVSCDVYGKSETTLTTDSFKYFVLTPEKLESLATDGYDTEKLLGLTYAEAATLLNTAQ